MRRRMESLPRLPWTALGGGGIAVGFLLFVAFGPVPGDAQDREVQIEAIPLADGVTMLTGRGGNMGLSVGADGALLIDDQFANLSEKIQAAIRKLHPDPVDFVINTHWHGDHVGGNANFAKAGALIIAHENVRKRMKIGRSGSGRRTPPAVAEALPVVTYADGVKFHFNGDTISVIHVAPSHTDGDSIVHFEKANVLHMGDNFFNGMYPFIDVDSGGHIEGMIAAVDRGLAIANDDTKIVPGHGPLSDAAGLREFRVMLVASRDAVAPLVEAGKTVEEIVAAKPTAALDDKWGQGFMSPERYVQTVVAGLQQHAKD